ncbi:transcriptional regulator family: Fungal Specific TF [Penicillium roqueforti]|nr:transcriptional regulator family: Fungal Specific TF [Penicillium roqueforti]KAI2692443.1 transcriptional regulator family: Fungal Specific TF [Penicillium roqueforti]KAI2705395.1 transcriptional regulator family: Fungal Specific TF [Penicillium roqueforti]KAI2731627.1 transcriptional regulator family: Fungal Specific TF [Penicillium roqueforti]KAI3166404.1 transcriptional regulator family: Fungal Specific TF [Penicillium roqueforti]
MKASKLTRPDGKVARLRASCDACNESKVRCSQAKPTCARCEKQNITCAYGLSRRSHKDAPRIGTQPTTVPESSESTGDASSQSAVCPPSPCRAIDNATQSTSETSDGICNKDTFDMMADSLSSFRPNMGLYNPQVFDAIDNTLDLHTGFHQVEDMLDGYDFLDQCLSLPAPGHTANEDPNTELEATSSQRNNHHQSATESPSHHKCSCTSHLMKQLVSLPLAFENQATLSFDVQLSELKLAVNVAKACMGCSCTLHDDMAMLMISILIGRVIQGFEKTLSIIQPMANTESLNAPSGPGRPGHAPTLSWGTLQIEADEEDELKQHMWLLQFKKFRPVLNQFNTYIGRLGGTYGFGDSAQVKAYQCIHMWLAQKMDNVNHQYKAQEKCVGQLDRLDTVNQVAR